MKSLYLIPVATLALCLATAQFNPAPMLTLSPSAQAPLPDFQLVGFNAGQAYVLDADMRPGDCVEAARANGLECWRVGSLTALPANQHASTRETPESLCALLLEAATRGAPDGYTRAESNCGAIY